LAVYVASVFHYPSAIIDVMPRLSQQPIDELSDGESSEGSQDEEFASTIITNIPGSTAPIIVFQDVHYGLFTVYMYATNDIYIVGVN